MKNILKITRATPEHANIVAPLLDKYRQFYGRLSDVSAAEMFLTKRLTAHQSIVFVAEFDGVAVGFAQIYPTFSSLSLVDMWVLNDLFIDDKMRKKNIGRQLLQHVLASAKGAGVDKLTLKTDKANTIAQGLYIANGWKMDEQFFNFDYP